MGSVKLKDLKAFVRYDGSGRVVSGSLVFRKKKPKNGRWVEIPKNLCCNENPSSTTTTTTQGGGSTPTAWVAYAAYGSSDACNQEMGTTIVLYTSTDSISVGTILYTDAALTQVYNPNLYGSAVAINESVYSVAGFGNPQIGEVLSITACGPTVYQIYCNLAFDEATACSGSGGFTNFPVYATTPTINYGTQLYLNATLTTPYSGGTWGNYVKPVSGNYAYYVPNATVENFGTICPSSYTLGVGPLGSSPEVCGNPDPFSTTYTLWASGTGYNTGRQFYYDSALTNPFTGTGWYAIMQGFPSGTQYSVYFNNGTLSAGFPC